MTNKNKRNLPKHYRGYSLRRKSNHSFQVRISNEGKSIYKTIHVPTDLSESKQYAYAEKEAIRIRDCIKAGASASVPTFAEYANYIMDLKKKTGTRNTTLNQYKYLLVRILEEFGECPLDQITPIMLNQFYIKLSECKTRTPKSAIAIPNKLESYLLDKNITYHYIHQVGNIGKNTVSLAVHGQKVSFQTADKICRVLNVNFDDYFYKICNEESLSSKTIKEHITLISTILNQAVRDRIIDYNPVLSSTVPKLQPHEPNYLQPETISKIRRIIEQEPLKWRLILSLLIMTGCRRGEIAGMQWDSIIWEHSLLRIDHEALYNEDNGLYIENSTKNGEIKYVQLDGETMQYLREYHTWFLGIMHDLRISPEDYPKFVFFQAEDIYKPIHPSSLNSYLKKFSKKYHLTHINPHALRHSLASALIAEGVDEFAVSKILGHKQVSTTREIYTHQIQEHQAKVAKKIPEIYKKSPE